MSLKEFLRNHLPLIRLEYREAREELRWLVSGDPDKSFWTYVHELRSRRDAGPDNNRFVGDLHFASKVPHSLSNDPERVKRWIEVASTVYKEDPLTQLIVAGVLMRITDVVPAARGKQRDLVLLNIERLCLMGECRQPCKTA
jgi:hypothetical protein